VSGGRGLGEERLGGWRTEEREEGGGAGQIPTDDRAKRGWESYWERQLGEVALSSGFSGANERRTGQNGDGAVADAFEKWLGGAGQRGKKGGRCGCVRVEEGEGGEGGPGMAVGSSGRLAMVPDRQAWATWVMG
jgi:hypothetical protein